ncbi:MAG TPA: hypothetical protein VHQ67_04615 [Nitrospiraceae bacterium]|nr:hypothetical protein [Nitrospiraceae bacterium]
MDQRRGDVNQDISEILQTRTAIGEKLELLERRIEETVGGAKSAAEDFVDRVRDSAEEFLDRTKETFDPTHQVANHPWLMLGGAIAAGYVLGLLEGRLRMSSPQASGVSPYYPPDAKEAAGSVMPSGPHANIWEGVSREVSKEIEHAKEAVIEVGRTFVHDFFEQVIPAVAESVLHRPRQQRFEFSREKQKGNGSDSRPRL